MTTLPTTPATGTTVAAIPDYLQNLANKGPEHLKKPVGGEAGPRFPRIGLKNSRFNITVPGMDTMTVPTPEIHIVVIDDGGPDIGRMFYAGAYDPAAAPKLPECWSQNGEAPAAAAAQPQAKFCMSCPQNAKDSNGKRPCRFRKNIAIMVVGDQDKRVYQLPLNATSLFGKTGYLAATRALAEQGIPRNVAVLKAAFPANGGPSQLEFTHVGYVPQEMAADVEAAYENREMLDEMLVLVNGLAPKTEQQAIPAQQAAPAQAAPAQQAAPVQQAAPAEFNAGNPFAGAASASQPAQEPAQAPVVEATPAGNGAPPAPDLSDLQNIVKEADALDLPTG